jgi:hypothetical protein
MPGYKLTRLRQKVKTAGSDGRIRGRCHRSVAAGSCRSQQHLCPRATKRAHVMLSLPHIIPPGWKPGDTAAKDGYRYGGNARTSKSNCATTKRPWESLPRRYLLFPIIVPLSAKDKI